MKVHKHHHRSCHRDFVAAKKACLLRGSLTHRKGFKRKIAWKRSVRIYKAELKLRKGAFKRIPTSGVRGAKRTLKRNGQIIVPSDGQIKARALKMANTWAQHKGGCGSMQQLLSLDRRPPRQKKITHNRRKARKLAAKYKEKAAKAKAKFKKAQAAAKARRARARLLAASARAKERAGKASRAIQVARLRAKVAAAKKRQERYRKRKAAARKAQMEQTTKKHAEKALKARAKKKAAERMAKAFKAERAKRARALARARAIRAKKERAHKNRVVRRCSNSDSWANCTVHPISLWTNCKGAGTSRVPWRRCGFWNAGGQYLCRRTTCRMVRVRV